MMRLQLHVVYEGEELVYDMPVGDGRMTIKWLGEWPHRLIIQYIL